MREAYRRCDPLAPTEFALDARAAPADAASTCFPRISLPVLTTIDDRRARKRGNDVFALLCALGAKSPSLSPWKL
jgi:hypothetical protein